MKLWMSAGAAGRTLGCSALCNSVSRIQERLSKMDLKGISSLFAPPGWGRQLKRESAEWSAVMSLAEVSLDRPCDRSGRIVPQDTWI